MGEWGVFLKRISRFFIRLVKNVRFLLYFFLTICIFGALGAWIPFGQIWLGSESVSFLNVYRNLATYIISIAVTALADCIVRSREDDDGTFRLFLLGLTAIAVISAIVVLLVDNLEQVKWISIIGGISGAAVWLMVNDAHPDLMPPSAYSPLGGEFPR
jgi:uncharacterized membrane protein YeaQ/YmgE (transglycosylase-associated protein family)